MKVGQWLAAGLLALLPALGLGATVTMDGQTLVISGRLYVADEQAIIENFQGHAVRTVRFEDCLGGAFSAQETLDRFIKTNRTATEAKGLVASACAFAFMAGSSRILVPGDRTETQLAFHAPVSSVTGVLSTQLAAMMRLQLMERSGWRITPALAELMVPPDNSRSWFRVFLNPGVAQGRQFYIVYCRGDLAERAGCDAYTDADALSLGLVTEPKSEVDEPPSKDR